MNAYTVSRLALEAGVSVHIVRDYLLRGLLRPVACTTGGYGLFGCPQNSENRTLSRAMCLRASALKRMVPRTSEKRAKAQRHRRP